MVQTPVIPKCVHQLGHNNLLLSCVRNWKVYRRLFEESSLFVFSHVGTKMCLCNTQKFLKL